MLMFRKVSTTLIFMLLLPCSVWAEDPVFGWSQGTWVGSLTTGEQRLTLEDPTKQTYFNCGFNQEMWFDFVSFSGRALTVDITIPDRDPSYAGEFVLKVINDADDEIYETGRFFLTDVNAWWILRFKSDGTYLTYGMCEYHE
ncbi:MULTISPECIES: hypothetical protein [unclassified Thiocapsa]|uniref:hypothetical protein n=1 Tax=unclassified Thiocapsa TaxID=2641286 RepID=UPI0035B2461E